MGVVNSQSFAEANKYYEELSKDMKGVSVRSPQLNYNEKGYNVFPAAWGTLLMAFGSDETGDGDLSLSQKAFHKLMFEADWPDGWEKKSLELKPAYDMFKKIWPGVPSFFLLSTALWWFRLGKK